jgi:hypothetical protein
MSTATSKDQSVLFGLAPPLAHRGMDLEAGLANM